MIAFNSLLGMEDFCDFRKIFIKHYNKLLYTWQTGRTNIKDLDDDFQCTFLSSYHPSKKKGSVFTICLHYERVFGGVFERETEKCCSVLKSHRCSHRRRRGGGREGCSSPN